MSIVKKIELNFEEIDAIFSTAKTLKSIYIGALEEIEKQGANYGQRKVAANAKSALQNVSELSIAKIEEPHWKRLYTQALILAVSIAEQLLKETFENLLNLNLENANKLERISITFEDLKQKDFKVDRSDCADIIKDKLYAETNPEIKINFQNIKTIEGTFRGYFGLEMHLSADLERSLHFFYQCRHILVHNAGEIDKRFMKNLQSAGINMSDIKLGNIIVVNEEMFVKCKKCFIEFFQHLETILNASSLVHEK